MGADYIVEVIQVYFEETPQLLADLQQALEKQDCETFRRSAHSIKSTSNSFGALNFGAEAKELEMMGREGKLEGAAPKVGSSPRELPGGEAGAGGAEPCLAAARAACWWWMTTRSTACCWGAAWSSRATALRWREWRLALEMLHSKPFDLVLLDIEMPEMDGYQVLEKVTSDLKLRISPSS